MFINTYMKRYRIITVIVLLANLLHVQADDSIQVSTNDLKTLLERIERLEQAQQQVDAYTTATPRVGSSEDGNTTAASTPALQPRATRLTIGGYGEAVMTRNFYSDHFNRYSDPVGHANDKSSGQFDLPHVVINLGYDFGHGWSFGTEIEFEHGGTESAVEIDPDEAGEYEAEVEKGGEVALEQFWIQKEFFPWLKVRAGEIIVPIGSINAHHLPTEFFTAYRPEGEMTLFPCTWHQLGVELLGIYDTDKYRLGYELLFLSGLDAERFGAEDFVHYGATSPYEYKIANNYALAARWDNTVKPAGLRLSLSGYVGNTFRNTQYVTRYNTNLDSIKGTLAIAAFDFSWRKYGVIMRGNVDYAHLGDARAMTKAFSNLPKHSQQDGTPRTGQPLADAAFCGGIEAGYDIFYYIPALHWKKQQLIPFVRYEYYNPMLRSVYKNSYAYTEKHRIAAGLNYYPIPEVVIKAEFSKRFLHAAYNDEPSVSLSIAYSGWFEL